MSATAKTEWQSKILLELAFFLRGYSEEPTADWRVKRPTIAAYRAAVDWITAIDVADLPLPRISPDREGGIQIEWDKLEIGILPTGAFEFLCVRPDGETEEGIIAPARARHLVDLVVRRGVRPHA